MKKQETKEYSHNSIQRIEKAEINRDFIHDMMKTYAEKNYIELNPHKPTLIRELDGLIRNLNKYGYLYCPCRLKELVGDLFIDKRNSCPCVYHKKELKIYGFCKCELFINPLEASPRLISTTIHRLKIKQQIINNHLEIYFEKEGENTGEVKIFIPEKNRLKSIKIETEGFYEIKERVFKDKILFFILSFTNKSTIVIEFS